MKKWPEDWSQPETVKYFGWIPKSTLLLLNWVVSKIGIFRFHVLGVNSQFPESRLKSSPICSVSWKMIPRSRPKQPEFYDLSKTKLLETTTLRVVHSFCPDIRRDAPSSVWYITSESLDITRDSAIRFWTHAVTVLEYRACLLNLGDWISKETLRLVFFR